MNIKKTSSSSAGHPSSAKLPGRELAVRLKTANKRTLSQQKWLERQLNDPYVVQAKAQGYRSRATFKLLEIDDRFHMLKPGMRVVDLGAAPGGWSQVAATRTGSSDQSPRVIAIDLLEVEAIPGVLTFTYDFMLPDAEEKLKIALGGKADAVLSDMAANTTGHKKTDHLKIIGLAEAAAGFALDVLAPGGFFLCKLFQGGEAGGLVVDLKRSFSTVRHIKPQSSRAGSSELYLLATGFKGL